MATSYAMIVIGQLSQTGVEKIVYHTWYPKLQKFLYPRLLQLGLPFFDQVIACNETFRNIYLLHLLGRNKWTKVQKTEFRFCLVIRAAFEIAVSDRCIVTPLQHAVLG
jgi:hypothetical protein